MKALIFVIAGTGTPRVSPSHHGRSSTSGGEQLRRSEPVEGRRAAKVDDGARAAKRFRIDAAQATTDS